MNTIVIKIGGSTLGSNDTTAEDLVSLQNKGYKTVVVHGGGKIVNQWLERCSIKTDFYNGLRITDLESLKIVTAVLSGLVNKEIVSDICTRGGKAIGLCGVDGQLMQAVNLKKELGYVGEKADINSELLELLLKNEYIPVIAPIGINKNFKRGDGSYLLNMNGDTAAADIAAALGSDKLIYLTDVPGLFNKQKIPIEKICIDEAKALMNSGVINGGMTVKIESCIRALDNVKYTRIVDGRASHALLNEIEGKSKGTTIVK
jgi:acetylglutamate kinase